MQNGEFRPWAFFRNIREPFDEPLRRQCEERGIVVSMLDTGLPKAWLSHQVPSLSDLGLRSGSLPRLHYLLIQMMPSFPFFHPPSKPVNCSLHGCHMNLPALWDETSCLGVKAIDRNLEADSIYQSKYSTEGCATPYRKVLCRRREAGERESYNQGGS